MEEHYVQIAISVIATVIGALILALVEPIRKILLSVVSGVVGTFKSLVFGLPQYLQLLSYVSSNKPLWEYRRFGKVALEDLPPVVTVVNFKGGVGKTTIAANLAASISLKHGKKVLLIDLDYQGSLSAQLIPLTAGPKPELNGTGKWLEAMKLPKSATDDLIVPEGLPNVRLLTADYDLAEIEDNQFQRWLLKAKTGGDVRSRFARHLAGLQNRPDTRFDLVIMDAPPRLSLAAANAVRASRMILIPVKLQLMSVEPVQRMLERLARFKEKSGGKFVIGGVIANMTQTAVSLTANESGHRHTLQQVLSRHPDQPVIFASSIPNTVAIGQPSKSPAYLDPSAPVEKFDKLAEEVLNRLEVVVKSP